jgi:hypothetical protein
MDQRLICLFLAIKGLSAQAIHDKLVTVLGSDAITYLTATRYLGQRQFASVRCDPSEEPSRSVLDNAISEVLEKQPFSSIHNLSKLTFIPITTVYRHLTWSLAFVVKHLRWVPTA